LGHDLAVDAHGLECTAQPVKCCLRKARRRPAPGVRMYQFDQIVELADRQCPFGFRIGQFDPKSQLNVPDDIQIVAIPDQIQRVLHVHDHMSSKSAQ
jgi:hypothetical protein